MIKLFLVDDEQHVIQGLLYLESNENEISVVGSSISEKGHIEEIKSLNTDIVLFNITIPEMASIEYCKQLNMRLPSINIIAFAENLTEKMLLEIWPKNADAVVSKSIKQKELLNVIQGVTLGHKILNKEISGFNDNDKSESVVIPHLTRTEIEVLKLLGSGLRRKEVAHRMDRSYYSVELHCKNIFKKFNNHKMESVLAIVRKARIIK